MKSLNRCMLLFGFLAVMLQSLSGFAQVPPWLADINQEIDLMEENIASCRADIEDFQAEIDALIKNTPPPITGTPVEDRIRELQKNRALWSCWADQAEKKVRRLKVIRKILTDKYGTASSAEQQEINHAKNRVDQVERKVQNMKKAGEKLGNTINGALGTRK